MDKSTLRLLLLLLVLFLTANAATLHLFFDDNIEQFNKNPYVGFGGWVAGILGTLLAIFSIFSLFTPKDPQAAQAQAQRRKRKDLDILRDKVQSFWIDGVFNASLHKAAFLQLRKESQPEQVQHPLSFSVELPNQQNTQLPSKTTITKVFKKQAAQHLLILGEPGAGKTTSLLELLRDLLKETQGNPGKPIPVVFPLSSWSAKPLPLAEWMALELSALYQIPKDIGRVWLREHNILPLFDGLDEVQADKREACAMAINQFAQEE